MCKESELIFQIHWAGEEQLPEEVEWMRLWDKLLAPRNGGDKDALQEGGVFGNNGKPRGSERFINHTTDAQRVENDHPLLPGSNGQGG